MTAYARPISVSLAGLALVLGVLVMLWSIWPWAAAGALGLIGGWAVVRRARW